MDSRTDIFSLGIVLYEMLAGVAPFKGDKTADVIAEVLQKQPTSIRHQKSTVPVELERIVFKCLRKDRKDRYQTPSDLLADLAELSLNKRKVGGPLARSAPAGSRFAVVLVGIVLLLGVALASYWYFH